MKNNFQTAELITNFGQHDKLFNYSKKVGGQFMPSWLK